MENVSNNAHACKCDRPQQFSSDPQAPNLQSINGRAAPMLQNALVTSMSVQLFCLTRRKNSVHGVTRELSPTGRDVWTLMRHIVVLRHIYRTLVRFCYQGELAEQWQQIGSAFQK